MFHHLHTVSPSVRNAKVMIICNKAVARRKMRLCGDKCFFILVLALSGDRIKKTLSRQCWMAKARNKNNAKHGSNLRAGAELRTKLASLREFFPPQLVLRSTYRNGGEEPWQRKRKRLKRRA